MNPLIPKIEARIRELVPELQENKWPKCVCTHSIECHTIAHVVSRESVRLKETNAPCLHCECKHFHVVSHPIQLHHVLQAIGKAYEPEVYDGKIHAMLGPSILGKLLKHWNLSKSGADQEEETKLFVGELIGIK